MMSYRNDFDLSIYLVADVSACKGRTIEDVVAAAVRGGVTMVQFREKTAPEKVIRRHIGILQDVLQGTGVPLIVNDHVTIAAEMGADGVHVGQGDMSARDAREIMGVDKIVGLTAYTQAHYDVVDAGVVDYVGTGPYFPTKTKPDKSVLGADGFRALVRTAPVPVVGIGGITHENVGEVIQNGAHGVAMMRGLSEAEDVEEAARAFAVAVRKARV